MIHFALVLALVAAASTAVTAGTVFEADLDGAQAGTSSIATGRATLVLNDAETEVAYTVTFTRLEGVEAAAHIHSDGPGQNGGVVHTLPPGTPKVGVWQVDAGDVAALRAGRIFVNVHSDLYASGEISGYLAFSSVPVEERAWGALKSSYR